MNNFVGIYYDNNGVLTKIVHADNDDFAPHDNDGTIRVNISKKAYDALPPAISVQGMANHYDLAIATLPDLMAKNPTAGAALQASINATAVAVATPV